MPTNNLITHIARQAKNNTTEASHIMPPHARPLYESYDTMMRSAMISLRWRHEIVQVLTFRRTHNRQPEQLPSDA
jgi:hypothetical protein